MCVHGCVGTIHSTALDQGGLHGTAPAHLVYCKKVEDFETKAFVEADIILTKEQE